MGAPDHVVASLENRDADEFEVWEQNWETVLAFLAVSTQWRSVPFGGGMAPMQVIYQGLDYTAVRAGLEGFGFEATPALWRGLHVMEAAARNVLNGIREYD